MGDAELGARATSMQGTSVFGGTDCLIGQMREETEVFRLGRSEAGKKDVETDSKGTI
jgi:hypothetical protein